jgi:hypothetical protein
MRSCEPMRIEALTRRSRGDRTRIEARFVYEDSYLPPVDVYYEAGPPLANALQATPEAFVLSGLPIALWEGERRLQVEGALDAKLAGGLGRAGALLASWYDRCGKIKLEPTKGLRDTKPRPQRRTVALMSGGVDAMAMLVENRRHFPLDHPSSIRTVLYAFGFSFLDRPKGKESPFMRARYEVQARRLEALGDRVGFDVIRVDTNVRLLDPSRPPFYYAAHSGAFLAPLIASPGYVGDALMASAGEGGPIQCAHGSHPMLDVEYSTGAVQVRHMQPQVARTDKVRMIADWEPAFDTLQVCHGWKAPSPDAANCGRCEKCMRTMVGLLICKALPRFTTFPHDDVTPEMIDKIKIKKRRDYLTMPEVIGGLECIGRYDLVRAIQTQVARLPMRRPAGPKGRWHRMIQNAYRGVRRLAT